MKTFTYPSKSSTEVHTVTIHDDGRVVCTCRGFRTPAKCWHVKNHDGATVSVETLKPPAIGFVDPMLARTLPEGMSMADYGDDWVLEPKIDGHRLIIQVTATGICAWSRAGNVRPLDPALVKNLEQLAEGTYDGELMLPGGTATDVTSVWTLDQLEIVIFDLLRVNGTDVTSLHGTERRTLLELACSKLAERVKLIPQFDTSQATLDELWAVGAEGAVVKRRSAGYQPGKRSKDWVKFKKFEAAEVTITAFEAGKLGPHSIIIGVDAAGVVVRVKALNDEWRAMFAKRSAEFIGRTLVIQHQGKAARGRYKSAMADHIL